MAIVIAVESTKGGAGKTTTATNLARGLQLEGYNVLIADRDPLRVTRTWREICDIEGYPMVIGADTANLDKSIGERMKMAFDYIIVDGAAVVEAMAASSIRAADIVLIPVQPSGADIWGCDPLIRLIKDRQTVTDGRPYTCFLINRQKKRTRLAKEIHEAINKLDVPILESRLSDNVLYTECLTKGMSVFDAKGARARQLKYELSLLVKEIKEIKYV